MSGGGDTAPVEEESRREEHHEQKAMDSKQPGAKFGYLEQVLRRQPLGGIRQVPSASTSISLLPECHSQGRGTRRRSLTLQQLSIV